jgi:hypothetical protein
VRCAATKGAARTPAGRVARVPDRAPGRSRSTDGGFSGGPLRRDPGAVVRSPLTPRWTAVGGHVGPPVGVFPQVWTALWVSRRVGGIPGGCGRR